jgi:hypothetical protein
MNQRRQKKQFKFWLFSDKLLYGEAGTLANMFTLNREILLTECRISEVTDGEDYDRALRIESPQKSFIIWAA